MNYSNVSTQTEQRLFNEDYKTKWKRYKQCISLNVCLFWFLQAGMKDQTMWNENVLGFWRIRNHKLNYLIRSNDLKPEINSLFYIYITYIYKISYITKEYICKWTMNKDKFSFSFYSFGDIEVNVLQQSVSCINAIIKTYLWQLYLRMGVDFDICLYSFEQ